MVKNIPLLFSFLTAGLLVFSLNPSSNMSLETTLLVSSVIIASLVYQFCQDEITNAVCLSIAIFIACTCQLLGCFTACVVLSLLVGCLILFLHQKLDLFGYVEAFIAALWSMHVNSFES